MDLFDFNGTRLFYSTNRKRGIPVVFLHGFCEDSSMWEDFLEVFEGDDYHIITVDLPGFGRSDVLPGASLAMMAQAVHALIESLQLGSILFIGHSMGGYIGLEMLRQKPGSFLGFGLFHSHPYADSAEKKAQRDKAMEFIQKNGHQLFVKQFIPGLFKPNFPKSNTFLVDKMVLRASQYPREGILTALKAMRDRRDNSEVLEAAKCPVLIIIGDADTSIPFEASLAQTNLPKVGSIHLLPGIGHMGMFSAKNQTQEIVRDFLAFCGKS